MSNTFFEELKKERASYQGMINFCCDSLILNNYIIEELSKNNYFFENFTGKEIEYTNENGDHITEEEYNNIIDNGGNAYSNYIDICQYYIISYRDAERLREFTNELVLYNELMDLYILCVCHYGTPWSGVPANWKDSEEV